MSAPAEPIAVVDLRAVAAALPQPWSPRVVGELNGQYVKVARLQGEFVWHDHAAEDELFLVLEGRLEIGFEDRPDVVLEAGRMCVVPRGLRHRPRAPQGCLVALFEPATTAHTGADVTPLTRSVAEQLGAPA